MKHHQIVRKLKREERGNYHYMKMLQRYESECGKVKIYYEEDDNYLAPKWLRCEQCSAHTGHLYYDSQTGKRICASCYYEAYK